MSRMPLRLPMYVAVAAKPEICVEDRSLVKGAGSSRSLNRDVVACGTDVLTGQHRHY